MGSIGKSIPTYPRVSGRYTYTYVRSAAMISVIAAAILSPMKSYPSGVKWIASSQ